MIICSQPDLCACANRNAVDIAWADFHFNDQRLVLRNDIHDRFARCDDAARRAQSDVRNDTVLRRGDFHTTHHILGGNDAFSHIRKFDLARCNLASDFGLQVAFDSRQGEFSSRLCLFCLRLVTGIFATITRKLTETRIDFRELRLLGKAFFNEAGNCFALIADEFNLPICGSNL